MLESEDEIQAEVSRFESPEDRYAMMEDVGTRFSLSESRC